MPDAAVQTRAGRSVKIVREAVIAVIEIAARITKEKCVSHLMRDVSVVGQAIAEHDDLRKHRRRLGENGGCRRNQNAEDA